jgi:hypothetical protein
MAAAAAVLTMLGWTAGASAGEAFDVGVVCREGSGQVSLTYSAIWSDSCVPASPTVQVVGRTIELHAIARGGICLTVLTPYTISGAAGLLCDGNYHTAVVIHHEQGGDPIRVAGPDVAVDCSIADFNNDCAVGVQDIFDFLAAYFAGDARADVNRSGGVTVQDVFDFLAAYFAAG